MNNYSMNVVKGDKVVISAPSGSGKTSLLHLILGFIDPDEGNIFVNQKEVKTENILQVRKHIGYLSQDIDFPNGTVKQVFQEIFSYSTNKAIPYSENKLIEKLKLVNLNEDILQKNTSTISGGERQRLGWVLIMLLDRSILLLDEPTSAMDEKQKQTFINYIIQTEKTVLCVSHDPAWQVMGFRNVNNLLT